MGDKIVPCCIQNMHGFLCECKTASGSDSPELTLLNAVVSEAKKVHKESAAIVRNKQNSEGDRWGASLRADTCQTLITVLERVKTTGI